VKAIGVDEHIWHPSKIDSIGKAVTMVVRPAPAPLMDVFEPGCSTPCGAVGKVYAG
jgi:hypothetical protein